MLNENIRNIRRSKGLSQEELAVRINVVRQTVSKWEQGLSVPDADLLIALAEALETPVSTLMGETVPETADPDELKVIAEKLEVLNLQLARRRETGRKVLRACMVALCAATVLLFAALCLAGSPYLRWDLSDPETAVIGTGAHLFEWVFVRAAPLLLIGGAVGIFLTRKRP